MSGPPSARVPEVIFRGALEAAPDAMIIVDESGGVVFANTQTERLFGYAQSDLLGRSMEILVPERFRARHPGHRRGFFADPRARPMGAGLELYGLHRDGNEFPVEISLSALETEQGRVVLAAIRDVTQRRRAEAALRESEKSFSTFFHGTSLPLSIARASDGAFTEVNQAFLDAFGWGRADVIGATAEKLRMVEPAGRQAIRQRLDREGHLIGTEVQVRTRSGEMKPMQVSIERITLAGVECVATSYTDIGAVKDAEAKMRGINAELERRVAERTAELRRSNDELQQFAYVASHDLQEPLRTVSGAVTRIAARLEGESDEKLRSYVRYALEGTDRMRNLIEDLLALSRVGTHGTTLAPTSSEEALRKALTSLKEAISSTGADVSHGPLPVLPADASQLTQLFQNLVGNGIKFHGADPPRVRVTAEREGSAWHFRVQDNGIGIAPQHLERIFVIFQRLDSNRFPGTGIGLAIAKKIVERHGGRIWARSEAGGGSTIHFTLPAEASP